jgi:hypothetical protein
MQQIKRKVKILRAHPKYSYSEGDKGVVPPDQIDMLVSGGYVLVIAKIDKAKLKMLEKMKGFLNKTN